MDKKPCAPGECVRTLETIDGPCHYSDHNVDNYHLYRCNKCKRMTLNHAWCVQYDMTGDNDRYDSHQKLVTIAELADLLVSLDTRYDSNPPLEGRHFPGAINWATSFGDAALLSLVRARQEERLLGSELG